MSANISSLDLDNPVYDSLVITYNNIIENNVKAPPDILHTSLISFIQEYPLEAFVALGRRLKAGGLFAEVPEYAPVIYHLKQKLHEPIINELCMSDNVFSNLRRHADLGLWHVSQSDSWYPYLSVLKAIYQALQFFDIYHRYKNKALNETVPLYHEFRYLYYFDKLFELSAKGDVIIMPTYLNIGATPFITMRGPPIYFIGVSTELNHVDEFIQTPAEFFIHDINHSRRLYANSLQAYTDYGYNKRMNLLDYYKFQLNFVQTQLRPLIKLNKNTNSREDKAIKQATKIILFELLHEDAEAAIPEIVCNNILRKPGTPTSFQIVVNNPITGTKNIKKVIIPGGGLLAFVKYKLRYGFMNAPGKMADVIAIKEARTTQIIATAAHKLLTVIGCGTIPSIEEIMLLVDDMTGQNPPEHPNHLGEPYNISKFTGRRPPPLPVNFFEREYKNRSGAVSIPWTGITKIRPEFEALEAEYSESIPNLAPKTGKIGGKRNTRRRLSKRFKTRRGGGCGCSQRQVIPFNGMPSLR
jgi:hypothetical protein